MIEFLLNHYLELSYIIISLVSLIVVLLKKVNVESIDTVFEQLLLRLPRMIDGAEKTGLSGPEKKDIVVSVAVQWLCDLTGRSRTEILDCYVSKIEDAIEEILSTPKKKENL